MESKEVSRDEMIKRLVASDLEGITERKCVRFLQRILYSGWKGYNEMSDSELMKTYTHRDFNFVATT